MPLTPGSVTIAPDGSATGSGLTKELYDSLESEYDAEPSSTPGNVPGAQNSLAKMARALGIPIAERVNADVDGSGEQGATGATGPAGPAGATGATGAQGPAGAAGAVGATGAQGPQGDVGPAGADGDDGADGAPGAAGPQGPPGLDGADGVDGAPGAAGAVGPQGPQGVPGIDGADGVDGVEGPPGAQGSVGAQGPQGPPGIDGADGADGSPGAVGAMGPQGPQGVPGLDGADGADGAPGAAGAVGAMGPQGPPGIDGADGADGSPGAAGAMGPQGPQGVPGIDGADGVDGADGAPGPQGAIGPQGPQGVPGLDGADGADGLDGAPGAQGAVGPQGPPGIDGADGVDGADGATGAAGPQGPQGIPGLDGADGADGAEGPPGPNIVVAPGHMLGNQIDAAGAVVAQPLTPAEQGENIRYEFVQVLTLAAGTYHDVEIDIRAKVVEFVCTGDVIVTGWKLVKNPLAPGAVGTPGTAPTTGNLGGSFRLYKHGFNSRLILLNYSGSVVANQIGNPNTIDFVLEQASTGVLIQYSGSYSKWLPLAKHVGQIIKNSTGTIFTRDLTSIVEGNGIAVTVGDLSALRATAVTIAVDPTDSFTWTGTHSFGNALTLATVHAETLFTLGALNVTLNSFATRLYILISGDGEIQSIAPAVGSPTAGRVVYCQIVGTGLKRIKHASGASHPTLPGAQANLLCPNNRDLILGNRASFLLVGDGGNGWLVSPISGGDITPWQLAPTDALNMGATFAFRVPFTAGTPGTADDVNVYLGAHFSYRIIDVHALVKTAIGASTLQMFDTVGGVGTALSTVLSSAATGTVRNNDTETRTVAAGGNAYLRRSDRGVAGELIVTAVRT